MSYLTEDNATKKEEAQYVVETIISLQRLGFSRIAELIMVAFYKEGYANVGEAPLVSQNSWHKAFKHVGEIPADLRGKLLEMSPSLSSDSGEDSTNSVACNDNSKAVYEGRLFHLIDSMIHRKNGDIGKLLKGFILRSQNNERIASSFLSTGRKNNNKNFSFALRPVSAAHALRNYRRQHFIRPTSSATTDHLSLRTSIYSHSVTAAAFTELLTKFYRRITVYAHQYLEPDSNSGLIPAKVYHVRFNRFGTMFATAGDDGLIKVWDSVTARVCYTIRRHFSDICDFDLSLSGRTAISCCSSNQIKVWRLHEMSWEPKGTATLSALPTFIRFLPKIMSPIDDDDSQSLLFASTADDGALTIWDAEQSAFSDVVPLSTTTSCLRNANGHMDIPSNNRSSLLTCSTANHLTTSQSDCDLPSLSQTDNHNAATSMSNTAASSQPLLSTTSLLSSSPTVSSAVPVANNNTPLITPALYSASIHPLYTINLHGFKTRALDIYSEAVPALKDSDETSSLCSRSQNHCPWFVFLAMGLEASSSSSYNGTAPTPGADFKYYVEHGGASISSPPPPLSSFTKGLGIAEVPSSSPSAAVGTSVNQSKLVGGVTSGCTRNSVKLLLCRLKITPNNNFSSQHLLSSPRPSDNVPKSKFSSDITPPLMATTVLPNFPKDSVAISHDIMALPIDSKTVPDVSFASRTLRLVTGTDDGQVLLWTLVRPLESSWHYQLPLHLKLLVTEKMAEHAYRVYQHPLSRQETIRQTTLTAPNTVLCTDKADLFTTQLTALVWCDDDNIIITGNSVSRKTAKTCDHEKVMTKETEIAIFDTTTGQRLLSITDKRKFKSNISFIRVHPIVSSLVVLGTFRGQMLFLNVQRESLLNFLTTVNEEFYIQKTNIGQKHYLENKHVATSTNNQRSPSVSTTEESSKKNITKKNEEINKISNEATSRNSTTNSRIDYLAIDQKSLFNVKYRSIEELDQFEGSTLNHKASSNRKNYDLGLVLKYLSFPKACFLDGRWCPNGQFFVASQRDGCFSIFTSIGCNSLTEVMQIRDSMCLTSVEQFLDNDFRVFQADSFNRVICPFTGFESHRLPTGPELDGDRVPLPIQHPRPTARTLFNVRNRKTDKHLETLDDNDCTLNYFNNINSQRRNHLANNNESIDFIKLQEEMLLLKNFNLSRLDEYGNIIQAVEYSSPTAHRTSQRTTIASPTSSIIVPNRNPIQRSGSSTIEIPTEHRIQDDSRTGSTVPAQPHITTIPAQPSAEDDDNDGNHTDTSWQSSTHEMHVNSLTIPNQSSVENNQTPPNDDRLMVDDNDLSRRNSRRRNRNYTMRPTTAIAIATEPAAASSNSSSSSSSFLSISSSLSSSSSSEDGSFSDDDVHGDATKVSVPFEKRHLRRRRTASVAVSLNTRRRMARRTTTRNIRHHSKNIQNRSFSSLSPRLHFNNDNDSALSLKNTNGDNNHNNSYIKSNMTNSSVTGEVNKNLEKHFWETYHDPINKLRTLIFEVPIEKTDDDNTLLTQGTLTNLSSPNEFLLFVEEIFKHPFRLLQYSAHVRARLTDSLAALARDYRRKQRAEQRERHLMNDDDNSSVKQQQQPRQLRRLRYQNSNVSHIQNNDSDTTSSLSTNNNYNTRRFERRRKSRKNTNPHGNIRKSKTGHLDRSSSPFANVLSSSLSPYSSSSSSSLASFNEEKISPSANERRTSYIDYRGRRRRRRRRRSKRLNDDDGDDNDAYGSSVSATKRQNLSIQKTINTKLNRIPYTDFITQFYNSLIHQPTLKLEDTKKANMNNNPSLLLTQLLAMYIILFIIPSFNLQVPHIRSPFPSKGRNKKSVPPSSTNLSLKPELLKLLQLFPFSCLDKMLSSNEAGPTLLLNLFKQSQTPLPLSQKCRLCNLLGPCSKFNNIISSACNDNDDCFISPLILWILPMLSEKEFQKKDKKASDLDSMSASPLIYSLKATMAIIQTKLATDIKNNNNNDFKFMMKHTDSHKYWMKKLIQNDQQNDQQNEIDETIVTAKHNAPTLSVWDSWIYWTYYRCQKSSSLLVDTNSQVIQEESMIGPFTMNIIEDKFMHNNRHSIKRAKLANKKPLPISSNENDMHTSSGTSSSGSSSCSDKHNETNNMKSFNNVYNHSVSNTEEAWFHKSCLFSTLYEIEAETSRLLITEITKQEQELSEASIRNACVTCGKLGATVNCSSCGACHHTHCARESWLPNVKPGLRELPLITTCGQYICTKNTCSKFLRHRHPSLFQDFYATYKGIRSRDWLLVDSRPQGDYVPQLCDIVRFFPQIFYDLPVSRIRLPSFYKSHLSLDLYPADAVVVNISYVFPSMPALRKTVAYFTNKFHIIALINLLILPPHPSAGHIIQIPHIPCDTQPIVLLSEVQNGLNRLSKLREGDHQVLFIDGQFQEGIISKISKSPKSSLVHNNAIIHNSYNHACGFINILPNFSTTYDEWAHDASSIWSKASIEAQNVEGIDCIELIWPSDLQTTSIKTTDAPMTTLPDSPLSPSSLSINATSLTPEICSCWEVYPVGSPTGAGGDIVMDMELRNKWLKVIQTVCEQRRPRSSGIVQRQVELRNRTVQAPKSEEEPERVYGVFIKNVPEPPQTFLPSRIIDEGIDQETPSWIIEYWKEIALPMSLDLIQRRLHNNYYRNEIAIVFDLFLLYHNSIQFNGTVDVITRRAGQLLNEIFDVAIVTSS